MIQMSESEYKRSVIEKRQEREKHLLSTPHNWFSLVGLFPLGEGKNNLGGNEKTSITIPGAPQQQ